MSQVTASSVIAARLAEISPKDCQNEIDGHELLIADLEAEIFEIRAATTLEPVSKQAQIESREGRINSFQRKIQLFKRKLDEKD